MKLYGNAWFSVYHGEGNIVVAEVKYLGLSLAVEIPPSDGRWFGERFLFLSGGCSRRGPNSIGMPTDEAHVFAVGARSCQCGRATR